jgi:predicted CXXCH cytochrome family protein
MKTKVIIAAMAILGMGINAFAAITDSAHDFSNDAWSGGEICVVCHTPHGGTAGFGPLWNRGAYTNTTFTMYTSTGLEFDNSGNTPGPESKACLSCHDGSVALDSYGGSPTTNTVFIPESHRVGFGGDLSGEHPIGFTFTETIAADDGQLHNPTNSAVAELLFSGDLECASCHDVHNDLGVAGLLRVDNGGSGLCLTCHDK